MNSARPACAALDSVMDGAPSGLEPVPRKVRMAETDIGPEDTNATVAAEPPRPTVRRAPEPPEQDAARWRRWGGWLVIAAPVAVSAVVGWYEIGGPSLWRDEAYTKDAIGRPVGQIFALLGHQDAVHGAYYLLMHVIAAVTGTS